MGEVDTNKTKNSTSIITQTDIGSIQNVKECISNGAARVNVYVKIQGNMVPIQIVCFNIILSTLRQTDSRIWFKMNDADQPWVKFTVITLLSYIIVTLNKAAHIPSNQRALLSGKPE